MGDRPLSHEDEIKLLRQRMGMLEHRLARLEEWVSMPAKVPLSTPIPPPEPEATAAEQVAPVQTAPLQTAPVQTAPLPPPPLPVIPAAPARDLEALIGQNWASWVGGIILLLGICFFLEYAWEQGWIRPSPAARVAVAALLGAGLCAGGEWLWRKRMRELAGTLHGTGIAVLIATFFGANRYFDPPVFSRGVAFAGVGIAAALGIALALRVNVLAVAALALIGAYLSPAVLSSGEDKSIELLSYLAILAAAQWVISFLKATRAGQNDRRFQWLSLRWLALIGSFVWFFAWWYGIGQRNDHLTLALAFVGFVYAGFTIEIFATLQVALARLPTGDDTADRSFASVLNRPLGPRAADAGLAVFALITTAVSFFALFVLLHTEPRRVLAALAIGLALVQAAIAATTLSRALMWSALLQSAALLTLAAPLYLDHFSITIAWLALAAAIATLAWQLNLPAARGWATLLLLLSVLRLAAFDASSPTMRTIVATIANQPITHWLALAWSTAVLFHLVAWMAPRRGTWPVVDEWLEGAWQNKRRLAGKIALDYQTRPRAAPNELPQSDALGIFLAGAGTILFLLASASQWAGSVLTLLALVWLAPIVILAPLARRLWYAKQAALLVIAIALHWLISDNGDPLLAAWNNPSRDATLPLFNLSALCIVVICAAVFQLARMRLMGELDAAKSVAIIAALLFAAATFECWRFVDFLATRGPAIADVPMVKQMAMSVLWSLIGFAAVLLGFWKDIRPLRICALVLLGVTVAKIFVIDMKNVQAVWRILSFIALGSLLLGVSYLYHQHQSKIATK
jgi:uncharacterized membrane protein